MNNTKAYTEKEWKRTPKDVKKYIESLESIIESENPGLDNDWELTGEMLKILEK